MDKKMMAMVVFIAAAGAANNGRKSAERVCRKP
jgi:hypothetical protein